MKTLTSSMTNHGTSSTNVPASYGSNKSLDRSCDLSLPKHPVGLPVSSSTSGSSAPGVGSAKAAPGLGPSVGRTETAGSSSIGVKKSLSEVVSRELLRGVRIERALRLFGVHWSSSVGSSTSTPEEEYALSEQVSRLDDFITHDWGTGRWWKFLSLCVIYNIEAALVVSLVVGVAAAVLVQDQIRILPKSRDADPVVRLLVAGKTIYTQDGCWCAALCPVTFILVLFFWQRIRSTLSPYRRYAFVDKLCICQTDEDLKKEGVFALAGFLNHTDRLVMLWSERTFTRLWCVYEVACWLHMGKDLSNSLRFAPTSLQVGILVVHLACVCFYAFLRIADHFADTGASTYFLVFSLLLVASFGPVHVLRRLVRSLVALPRSLEAFSVVDANCFCCTHDHKHPATGEQMQCDRELVYDMLKCWFEAEVKRKSKAVDEARRSFSQCPEAVITANAELTGVLQMGYLDNFNKHVRGHFKDAIAASAGSLRISYRNFLAMGAPAAWYALDSVGGMAGHSAECGLRRYCFLFSIFFFHEPLALRFGLHCIQLVETRWGRLQNRAADVLVTVSILLVSSLLVALLWIPARLTMQMEWFVPQVLILVLQLAITVGTFSRGSAAGCLRRCPARCACASRGRGSAVDRAAHDAEGPAKSAAMLSVAVESGDDQAERPSLREIPSEGDMRQPRASDETVRSKWEDLEGEALGTLVAQYGEHAVYSFRC